MQDHAAKAVTERIDLSLHCDVYGHLRVHVECD